MAGFRPRSLDFGSPQPQDDTATSPTSLHLIPSSPDSPQNNGIGITITLDSNSSSAHAGRNRNLTSGPSLDLGPGANVGKGEDTVDRAKVGSDSGLDWPWLCRKFDSSVSLKRQNESTDDSDLTDKETVDTHIAKRRPHQRRVRFLLEDEETGVTTVVDNGNTGLESVLWKFNNGTETETDGNSEGHFRRVMENVGLWRLLAEEICTNGNISSPYTVLWTATSRSYENSGVGVQRFPTVLLPRQLRISKSVQSVIFFGSSSLEELDFDQFACTEFSPELNFVYALSDRIIISDPKMNGKIEEINCQSNCLAQKDCLHALCIPKSAHGEIKIFNILMNGLYETRDEYNFACKVLIQQTSNFSSGKTLKLLICMVYSLHDDLASLLGNLIQSTSHLDKSVATIAVAGMFHSFGLGDGSIANSSGGWAIAGTNSLLVQCIGYSGTDVTSVHQAADEARKHFQGRQGGYVIILYNEPALELATVLRENLPGTIAITGIYSTSRLMAFSGRAGDQAQNSVNEEHGIYIIMVAYPDSDVDEGVEIFSCNKNWKTEEDVEGQSQMDMDIDA